MLDNLVTVLREHRKRQLATRMLLGDKWRPELGFENLVFTGGFGRCISETALYEDMKKIRTQIREDGHAFWSTYTPFASFIHLQREDLRKEFHQGYAGNPGA